MMMTKRMLIPALSLALTGVFVARPSAATKEQLQMMADLRMLQQQSQELQILLASLNETLKAVNVRLDQQTDATRKSFADQKLTIDVVSKDMSVVREKVDDNNVRIGSLTQELDSLRQSMQQMATRPAATNDGADPSAPDVTQPTSGPPVSPVGASPQKIFDAARGDYFAGQYDLAILGFADYVKSFPKSDMADDAQVNICSAYVADGKPDKAVEACDLAIRNYPTGDKIPEAYYRKGLALSTLKDADGARAAWEEIVKRFPETQEAGLARQGLERLKRP